MGLLEECVGHLRIYFSAWSSTQSNDEELQSSSMFRYCDKKIMLDATVATEAIPKYNWVAKGHTTKTSLCRVC